MGKNYLRGFSKFGMFPIEEDTESKYSVGERTAIPGAVSCAPTDNKTAYTIPADDGIWDSGSVWDTSTVVVNVVEAELKAISELTGAKFDASKKELEETTIDNAAPVALTYAALKGDGTNYRMFRWYSAKLTSYKITHNTKKEGAPEAQNYELTFTCYGRKLDNAIRTTADTDESTTITWLDTIPEAPGA